MTPILFVINLIRKFYYDEPATAAIASYATALNSQSHHIGCVFAAVHITL